MLQPKTQQISKNDIDYIKMMINDGMSHRQISKTTGWSVYTISRVRNGFYDKERQCQTVDINPLEEEVSRLKAENEKLNIDYNKLKNDYKKLYDIAKGMEQFIKEVKQKQQEDERPTRSLGAEKRESSAPKLKESHVWG